MCKVKIHEFAEKQNLKRILFNRLHMRKNGLEWSTSKHHKERDLKKKITLKEILP